MKIANSQAIHQIIRAFHHQHNRTVKITILFCASVFMGIRLNQSKILTLILIKETSRVCTLSSSKLLTFLQTFVLEIIPNNVLYFICIQSNPSAFVICTRGRAFAYLAFVLIVHLYTKASAAEKRNTNLFNSMFNDECMF